MEALERCLRMRFLDFGHGKFFEREKISFACSAVVEAFAKIGGKFSQSIAAIAVTCCHCYNSVTDCFVHSAIAASSTFAFVSNFLTSLFFWDWWS